MLSPALIVPSPALITTLITNRFPNKLVPNVPKNTPRNPLFYSFASLYFILLTPFINTPDSSRDLIIFMISFISSFEIINFVVREAMSEGRLNPKALLWIATSVAAAAAVYPNSIKTLLANGLSTVLIKDNPVFSNGPKSLPKNPPDYPILCNWDNFILAEEIFVKDLRKIETCVLVNNNLCRKLFSLLVSPTTFVDSFKVTSFLFFIFLFWFIKLWMRQFYV